MKARYWLIIPWVVGILAGTFIVDQTKLLPGSERPAVGTSTSTLQGFFTLPACDPEQVSYLGLLFPDQGITSSNSGHSDHATQEKVPESLWSKRAGFSISAPTDPRYWAELLGSGWFLDWSVRGDPPIDNLEHWQMIRVKENCVSPSLQEIRSVAFRFPGQVWIIGNEPDVIWQDNVTPSRYAIIYHELYNTIKTADPTALVAMGGVSQATPLRLQYLDQVLQAYQNTYLESLPVDWWTVHGYVLREEKGSWGVDIPPGMGEIQGHLWEIKDHGRIDLFKNEITSFRQWMAERGYQHTPLALTEFGILMPSSYGFPSEFVNDYLEQTFTWLSQAQDESIGFPEDEHHLVQKWSWFSISDPTYSTSDLGDLYNGRLTLLGEKFHSMIYGMVP